MAAIFEQQETIRLDPRPGFVVKTRILEGKNDHIYGTKVFINVCHEPRVPKPSADFDPQVVFPLIVKNEWEIPIIVSLERKDADKKGVPSFVYDCCINSTCFQWVQVSKDLRLILVEWCLESVEMMHEIVLEREYAVPKMASKGELAATEITQEDLKNGLQKRLMELKQNETAGLIEALDGPADSEEDFGSLPDLTDIGGNRQRPLIEDLGEMSLEETGHVTQSRKIVDITGPANVRHSEERRRVADLKGPAIEEVENHSPLPYTFTIQHVQRGADFFVLFESKQLTPHIEVSFDNVRDEENQNSLIILRNLDSTRTLQAANRLDIPVPAGKVPYKSFLVEQQGQLFVFCREE